MPVTGPAFVHDLGADLGLKKYGAVSDDLHHRLHPMIFFFIQKLGMRYQILNNIKLSFRLLL